MLIGVLEDLVEVLGQTRAWQTVQEKEKTRFDSRSPSQVAAITVKIYFRHRHHLFFAIRTETGVTFTPLAVLLEEWERWTTEGSKTSLPVPGAPRANIPQRFTPPDQTSKPSSGRTAHAAHKSLLWKTHFHSVFNSKNIAKCCHVNHGVIDNLICSRSVCTNGELVLRFADSNKWLQVYRHVTCIIMKTNFHFLKAAVADSIFRQSVLCLWFLHGNRAPRYRFRVPTAGKRDVFANGDLCVCGFFLSAAPDKTW